MVPRSASEGNGLFRWALQTGDRSDTDGHVPAAPCFRGSISHPRWVLWLTAASEQGKNQNRGYSRSRACILCRRAPSDGAGHRQRVCLLLNLPRARGDALQPPARETTRPAKASAGLFHLGLLRCDSHRSHDSPGSASFTSRAIRHRQRWGSAEQAPLYSRFGQPRGAGSGCTQPPLRHTELRHTLGPRNLTCFSSKFTALGKNH